MLLPLGTVARAHNLNSLGRLLRVSAVTACIGLTTPVANATNDQRPPIIVGTETAGGLQVGAKLLHVTSLADSGPGSLREAIEVSGPRVILFDVAGTIYLESDLAIRAPHVTLVGQSAAYPGVTLFGASLEVRTHDVVLAHIAVRPGPGATPEISDNLDGISVVGPGRRQTGTDTSQDIMLQNVSVSWSVDEAVSIWYPTTARVSVLDSMIYEALDNAGHPKGDHSMGLLVGPGIVGVEIAGNYFVSNAFRNPALSQSSVALVVNNAVYNPRHNGVHFYARDTELATIAGIVANSFSAGPSTSRTMAAISIPKELTEDNALIFIDANLSELPAGDKGPVSRQDGNALLSPFAESRVLLPADEVKAHVTMSAGMFPTRRNPIDLAMLHRIEQGTEIILDRPLQTDLDLLAVTSQSLGQGADFPALSSEIIADIPALNAVSQALCDMHRKAGGNDCRAFDLLDQ